MGRFAFVSTLFVMALACFVTAISSSSWGWAIGGVIFIFVGKGALRQFKSEHEGGRETASGSFIVYALLAMCAGIAAIAILFPMQ